MPNIQVKLRRGTATEHNTFAGAEGEVTVDTTNDTLRVHDGSTAGGIRLAKLSEVSGGSGTVTSVGSGTGLTGGPITTSGTLSIADDGVGPDQLANTAVSPGSYTNTNLTVDAQGRITAASNGSVAVSKATRAWTQLSSTADGTNFTFTHNLGTSDVIVQIYVNSSASDVGALSLDSVHEDDSGFTPGQGAVVTSMQSSNAITVQLGTNGYYSWSSGGVMTNTTFNSKYIKVVVIG